MKQLFRSVETSVSLGRNTIRLLGLYYFCRIDTDCSQYIAQWFIFFDIIIFYSAFTDSAGFASAASFT